MRAGLVEELTEAGSMTWTERPDPLPDADSYVVRVEAAGANSPTR